MHLLATLALALLSPPRRLTPNPAGTHTTPFTSPDGVPLHTALSELKAALLDGYDASTPPAGSDGAAVEITIGLRLNKFHGVDVRRGVMEVGVWLRMWWNDPRLRWNESQHAGIPYFTLAGGPPTDVQLTQVWIPDVELLNGEDSSYNLPQHDVQVSSDGSCAWSRPGVLSSYCDLVGLELLHHELGMREQCGVVERQHGLLADALLLDGRRLGARHRALLARTRRGGETGPLSRL